jgi:hypothetical protein
LLQFGIHAQGHRGAGAKGCQQVIERGRAGIIATHRDRFIGNEGMRGYRDLLLVATGTIFGNYNFA